MIKAFLLLFTINFSVTSYAAELCSIEWVAQNIAKNHNANATSMIDNFVLSTSANAVGKNVIFNYVVNIKKNLPPNKAREFGSEMYNDILPKVCQANKQNEAFMKGLYYTFSYSNRYGEKVAEFSVSKEKCRG